MTEINSLAYASYRVGLAIKTRPILPDLALRYRLCEVGAPRLNPRILGSHLRRLSETESAVVLAEDDIYAASAMLSSDREKGVEAALATLRSIGTTAAGIPAKPHEIVRVATEAIRGFLNENDVTTTSSVLSRTDGRANEPPSFLIQRNGQAPISLMFGHSSDWVYPDAVELWSHLRSAAAIGAHPVYIARKVAPITFPLLAAFNARALQYYDILTVHAVDDGLRVAADDLGLPRIRQASVIAEHAFVGQLMDLIDERPDGPWNPRLTPAFDDAIQRGFADTHASSGNLADWADAHDLLATRWAESVRSSPGDVAGAVDGIVARAKKRPSTKPVGFGRETRIIRVPFKV